MHRRDACLTLLATATGLALPLDRPKQPSHQR